MKLLMILITSLLSIDTIASQNLVPNPSFENNWECPTGWNFSVSNWYRLQTHQGSADYMHMCSTNPTLTIPGAFGSQVPVDGSGYIGIFCYNPNYGEIREYFQVQLNSPLVANQYYKVSFFVTLSAACNAGVNNIGAVFTDSEFGGDNNTNHISLTPQIFMVDVIIDQSNWVEVSGSFQAVGGEQFLTIGNFSSDEQLNVEILNSASPPYAYYLIDSVSVTSQALNVNDFLSTDSVIYPNPFQNHINISLPSSESIQQIEIYSITGLLKRFIGNPQTIDLSDLSQGFYIAIISTVDNKKYINRLIKN